MALRFSTSAARAIAAIATCALVAGACTSTESGPNAGETGGSGTTSGMKDYQVHTNAADATIATAHTRAGDTVTFLGTKNASGVPTAVTAVDVVAAGGDHTFVLVDTNGHPVGIRANNGSQYNLTWNSPTPIDVTAIVPDGSVQVKTTVTLPAGAGGSAGGSSTRRGRAPTTSCPTSPRSSGSSSS